MGFQIDAHQSFLELVKNGSSDLIGPEFGPESVKWALVSEHQLENPTESSIGDIIFFAS